MASSAGDDALAALTRRLEAAPDDGDAHHAAADVHLAAGRFDRAAAHLRVAVAVEPASAVRWTLLAAALVPLGRLAEARLAVARALERDARIPAAWTTLGQLEVQAGDAGRARQAFEHALALSPGFAPARHGLATALEAAGRLDEALAAYGRVIEMDPSAAEAHYRIAVLRHRHWGDAARAIEHYRAAAALDPRHASARHNLAHALLLIGRLEEAWPEHAWRPPRMRHEALLAREGRSYVPPAMPLAAGSRLVILSEQGLGDTLFFLRFAAAARAAGVAMEFVGDARLHPMLARTGWFSRLVEDAASLPEGGHARILAGDLPLLAPPGAWMPSLPLRPSSEAREAVRRRLAALGPPPYVAVAWRAGDPRTGPHETLYKEVPVAHLGAALAGGHATWIAVQREPRPEELEALRGASGRAIHDLSEVNRDLESALALMQAVDDYVGVSSTLVHLRAGIAAPARILVPFPPDWRWMAEGDSPWFPGMRTYRQARGAGWSAALEALARDLAAPRT